MIRIFAFLPALALGLYLPDVDQSLRSILNHRSILTHSALIPALLLTPASRGTWRGDAIAGLAAGFALHMGADALSVMRGYALIYFPWPLDFSIGGASRWWLIGNSLVCLAFAWSWRSLSAPLLICAIVLCGLAYAVFNEGSLVLSLLILAGGFGAYRLIAPKIAARRTISR
ncbi:hypothetical protein ACFSM5_03830 [Lacibacterium aquatile]|uniref:Metal-dependent hydrolase n=1 Tax=Lacibacterium aquatile TaxID=1168082 RepID=A0ABW5DPZ0_9PROT